MVVDAVRNDPNPTGRSMHTEGKMYGLKFSENWYIIGESDGKGDIPPFKLVAYKGHTLQGNYEGSFVYAKEPILPAAAIPAVRKENILLFRVSKNHYLIPNIDLIDMNPF